MNAPVYSFGRIRSIESLERALRMPESAIRALATKASKMYFVAKRIPKEDGTIRVLFDTRQPLKAVLQRINSQFLKKVQYPPYLTGGVPGKDYVSSARLHANATLVIKEDIQTFFPSVHAEVVLDIWERFFGFSTDVAQLLTLLTTRDGHLEQGAPTSGYLANLALWDVEARVVSQLARECGLTGYSRHVDDICMSSPSPISTSHKAKAVSLIYGMLASKNLAPKRAKHITMHGGQQIRILKLVANRKPSLSAIEQSRIRAAVHQFCRRAANLEDSTSLRAELPKIRGLVHHLKRFHPRKAAVMLEAIDRAARALNSIDVQQGDVAPTASAFLEPVATNAPGNQAPWD